MATSGMDAGTVTLVIYLAGLGHPWWELDVMAPRMTRAPVHHPLVVPMRSMEACKYVAERERARGNRARCQTIGVEFLRSEETGDLELATQLYIITFGKGPPNIIGGFPSTVPACKTFTRLDKERPRDRHTSVCVKVPVWIMDKRDWRLVGNRLLFKSGASPDETSAKAP